MSSPTDGGRRLIGTVLTLPGAGAAELTAEAFDLIWIDLEHGAIGRGEAQTIMIGAQAAGAQTFVRIPAARGCEQLAGAMLDAGADGIVAPNVREADELLELERALRYPPDGTRGFGPRRVALRGRHRHRTSSPAQLWVQIESQAGAANASQIAAIDGVSALVVGAADLAADIAGDWPEGAQVALADAARAVRDAAIGAGRRFGIAGPLLDCSAELAEVLLDAQILVHSTDARLYAAGVDRACERLRSLRPREQVGLP